MSASRSADGFLYTEDAVDVGILIFGERICRVCGEPLPANTDYFAPDKSNTPPLVYECRRCRRALERERHARRRREGVTCCGQLELLGA